MAIATTIRLPPSLKKRVDSLAKSSGRSAQEWIVDALEREERRQSSFSEAKKALEGVARGEPVWDAEEVFAYARAKVAGRKSKRPRPLQRSKPG